LDGSTASIVHRKLNRPNLLQLLRLVLGEIVLPKLVRVRQFLTFWGNVNRSTSDIIHGKLNPYDLLQLLRLVWGETVIPKLVRFDDFWDFGRNGGEEDDTG
jgi:uncharacterized protein Usg